MFWLFFATLAFLAALAVIGVVARRYTQQRAEVARLRALFARYVPPQVVDDLLRKRDPRLFEAREYYATILSARIRNFGLLCEGLSPDETLRYLNEFYAVAVAAIHRHRGMIESLRGDTVTGVFGVLVEETFQEERAIRAGLDIARVVKSMESRWRGQNRKPIGIGIGINSGKIVAGDAGTPTRREYAIVGNPAQVAERLVGIAEDINASVVAAEATFDPVQDIFIGIPISSLPLRGLKKLQRAVVIRGLAKHAPEDEFVPIPSDRAIANTILIPAPQAPEPSVYPDAQPEPDVSEFTFPPLLDEITDGVLVDEFSPLESTFSSLDDSEPALPELPAIAGTYEDNSGPPFRLSP